MKNFRIILAALLFGVSVFSLLRFDLLGFGLFFIWGASTLIDPAKSRESHRRREALMLLVAVLAVIRLYLAS
jgi:hypothetical protein